MSGLWRLLLIGALALGGGAIAQPVSGVERGEGKKLSKVPRGAKAEGVKGAKGSKSAKSAKSAVRTMPWRVAFTSRQWRNALPGLREALASNPDDADLHAHYAIVSARIGRFADALPSFEYGAGAEIYEEQGIGLHADALRATGRADEAAALRRAAFISATRWPRQLSLVMDLADDLRYAGDLLGAEDAAWLLVGEAPGMEEAYALLADVALDRGDTEEAALQLWLADLYGTRTSRTRAARGRLQLAYGDLDEAIAEVSHGRMRGRNHMPIAIHGEVLRRQGMPDACLARLDVGTVPDKERPEIAAVRLACLASDGQLAEAAELRTWVMGAYPEDPNVLAASAVLDKALAKAGSD